MTGYSSIRYLQKKHSDSQCDVLALILAGGSGTRLKNLTHRCAKPAVAFGGGFRNIDFTLSNCFNSKMYDIGVLVQHQADSLEKHIDMAWRERLAMSNGSLYLLSSSQEKGYQGTADAVFQNGDFIRQYNPRYTLILAGDHIYTMDYREIIRHHSEQASQVTVCCSQVPIEQAHAFGVMEVDWQHRITNFEEKPTNPKAMLERPDYALVSMGIYLFDTDFLLDALAKDAANPYSSHDFGKDIIPFLINRYQVSAFKYFDNKSGMPAYWRDIGSIDSYWHANMDLLEEKPALNLYNPDWPISSYSPNLPPAKFTLESDGIQGKAESSLIAPGCIIKGATVSHSILFHQVKVDSHSELNDCVVLPGAIIGKHCLLNRAIIGENCRLPDNTIINPQLSNDLDCYVSPEGIALIVDEMLDQSQSQLLYA